MNNILCMRAQDAVYGGCALYYLCTLNPVIQVKLAKIEMHPTEVFIIRIVDEFLLTLEKKKNPYTQWVEHAGEETFNFSHIIE